MSGAPDLSDNCFAIAAHALGEISDAIAEELGRRPNLEELCQVLLWSLREAGEDLVGDVNPGRIDQLTFKLRSGKTDWVKPGDVIAVPGPDAKYYIGIFITKNRIGHAFGFFHGLWPARPLKPGTVLQPCGRPIYTGLHSLWDGSWMKIGESEELLRHFDREPEIYHKKRDHPNNPAIGPFGSAERPSTCELRSIDEEEAARVGLVDGSYRQTMLSDMVPKLLEKWNCQA